MKFNKWTVGLAAVGVVSLASAARADEQMNQVQTARSQTTLSGYVDTAMQWNPNTDMGPRAYYPGHVPHYAFAQDDGFQFNAVDIALDKPEDSSQWSAGYHVEMMYGDDAVGVPIAYGTYQSEYTASATVRQAFIRLHTPIAGNGLDWELGVFDSPIGYESSSDPLDPNYTRSYSYTIEPKTFVGIMGTYKVSDMLSISGGIANDEYGYYDSQYNYAEYNEFVPGNSFESEKCYFGSVSLTAPDSMGFLKGATLSGGVIHNLNTFSDGADYPQGPTTSLYAGVTLPTPVTQLKVGGSFDYLFEDNIGAGVPSTGADLWDIAGYATFQASDKLSLNLRAEFYDNRTAGDDAPIGLYDNNNAEEVTATVQYNLFANVITRGEFRWDHVEHGEAFGYNNFGDTDRSNDFLLALNVIYQF